MENTCAATCNILVFTPWPISTAPVVMPTLPSVYTCTNDLAWFIRVLVKEIPKQTGMQASPFLYHLLAALNVLTSLRMAARSYNVAALCQHSGASLCAFCPYGNSSPVCNRFFSCITDAS